MESYGPLGGKPVMRSSAICSKGSASSVVGMRYSGVRFRCVMFLFCWHVAHPATYLVTHVRIPGHQYSRDTWVNVSSRPGCPAVGASCNVCRISRRRVSSRGITIFSSFNHRLGSFASNRVAPQLSRVSCSFCCTSRIFVRREVGASVVALIVGRVSWHCSQFSTYFSIQSFMSGHQ